MRRSRPADALPPPVDRTVFALAAARAALALAPSRRRGLAEAQAILAALTGEALG